MIRLRVYTEPHFTTVLLSVLCLFHLLSPINPFALALMRTPTISPLVSFVSSDLQSCLICIACRIPRAQPFSTESFITKQDPTGNTRIHAQE